MGTCYTIHAEIMLGEDWHCLATFELGKAYSLTDRFAAMRQAAAGVRTTPLRYASDEVREAIELAGSCYVLAGARAIERAMQDALAELASDGCGDVPRAHQYMMLRDWAAATELVAPRLVLTGL